MPAATPQAPATMITAIVARGSRVIAECYSGRREGKINQVPGEAVGRRLNRGAVARGVLYGLDDLAKARVTADARGPNVERPRLIDGPGETSWPSVFDRHGFARD